MQQPREQAEEEHPQRRKRRTGNRKTVGEDRRYSVCQRADQRLLRSDDPWRYGPCQGLLIRTLSLRRADPQEVRSVSGADQHPVGKSPLPNCRVCGPCQGLTNVLLPHCPRRRRRRRPPRGTVHVRGRAASSCQVPTPWRYGQCHGADYHSLAKCRPMELTVRVRGQ